MSPKVRFKAEIKQCEVPTQDWLIVQKTD